MEIAYWIAGGLLALVRGEAKALPANIVLLLVAVAVAWIGFIVWT